MNAGDIRFPRLHEECRPDPVGKGRHGLFAAAAVILLTSGLAVAALWRELGGREGDAAEELAGILGAARRVTAFLGGDAVVHDRHNELCVPFQPDDRELAQGHVKPSAVPLHGQVLVKERLYPVRQLHGAVPPAAFTGLPDPGAQHHGIQRLYC